MDESVTDITSQWWENKSEINDPDAIIIMTVGLDLNLDLESLDLKHLYSKKVCSVTE